MSLSGIGKTIFTQDQIQQRVAEIGYEINRDYQGEELVIVSVLKGSFYFVADLTRHLTIPLNIDFLSVGVSSDETTGSRVVRFTKGLNVTISGRHVLLVEDIIGTGLTLGYVYQHLEDAKPASLKICTLLDNPAKRLLTLTIDYRCFIIPNLFVVGYGLDYKEEYRNLPYIAEYHREQRR